MPKCISFSLWPLKVMFGIRIPCAGSRKFIHNKRWWWNNKIKQLVPLLYSSGGEVSGEGPVKVDVVLKLGGAAVTDKTRPETLRPLALQQGAALVRQCVDRGLTVVVVHGAGSFGHHLAKKYRVNDGLDSDRDFTGFCLTRNSVTTLTKHVIESLTNLDLPAVACQAFPCWQTASRRVTQWPQEAVGRVLRAGLVPVLHGDCVLDSGMGCCILSGDTIIQTLCENFTVRRVVFLTDVDGVYDKPPSEPGAQLLRCITLSPNSGSCEGVRMSAMCHDVSGGITTKVQCAASIVTTTGGLTRVFVARLGSGVAETLCTQSDLKVGDCDATEVIMETHSNQE